MANMELVTAHKGSPHITVDQVRDLFAGLSGDLSGIKIFSNLGNALNYQITDVLQIEIGTGQGLAGGFFFQLLEKFIWNLDPGTMGYSRIDMLYLVIYEDTLTNVQSADLAYMTGLDYPNGGNGVIPAGPSGSDIEEIFPLYRADVKDGSILSVTSYALPYLSNDTLKTTVANLVTDLEESVGGTVEQVTANTSALNGLRFGIDSNGNYGYMKVGADSVTPFRNPKGNAAVGEVLSGKSFANASNDELTGTMTNRGAWSDSGTGRSNVTIPEGYHNGSGYVNGIGKWDAGRAQGHADKRAYTMRVTASNLYGIYQVNIYADGVLVYSDSYSGEAFDKSRTMYASYNNKLSSS